MQTVSPGSWSHLPVERLVIEFASCCEKGVLSLFKSGIFFLWHLRCIFHSPTSPDTPIDAFGSSPPFSSIDVSSIFLHWCLLLFWSSHPHPHAEVFFIVLWLSRKCGESVAVLFPLSLVSHAAFLPKEWFPVALNEFALHSLLL